MELNGIFCDGAVFQANKPIYVFGKGDGTVKIEFLGRVYEGMSRDGKWEIEIAPAAYADNLEMKVTLGKETRVIKNISVGEVVLVAGQSNMQFRLEAEKPQENHSDDERLRFFAVDRIEFDAGCLKERDGWRAATGENTLKHSAVGYHLGVEMRKKYGVTVGIVECYQGASIIQSWMSKAVADKFDELVPLSDRHLDSVNGEYSAWNKNGKLHDEMFLHIVPYSFSCVVWYQGESNTAVKEGRIYDKMLSSMIDEWRTELKDNELPFIVVVICDLEYRSDDGWKNVQNAQRRMTGYKNVRVVESYDVCEHTDIHPSDKRALSKRIFENL